MSVNRPGMASQRVSPLPETKSDYCSPLKIPMVGSEDSISFFFLGGKKHLFSGVNC